MNRSIFLFIVLACSFTSVDAQSNDSLVNRCFNALKRSKTYAFDYTISSKYPDGTSDKTTGLLYVNDQEKLMVNDCSGQTVIYNEKWFYRADHVAKEIGIISLSTFDKKSRRSLDESIFNNAGIGQFIDSFLLKNASVKKAGRHHDTAFVELRFPPSSIVTEIKLLFDESQNELISYTMTTYKPWPTSEFGKNKGTTEVTTYHKRGIKEKSNYNIEEYFGLVNKKVILKKFQQYKLETKL